MAPPALPAAPLELSEPSMLSRKFGREVANYFAGSPLNRVSFLRTDYRFLDAALHHASTRFLVFKDMGPLTSSAEQVHFLGWEDTGAIIDRGTGGPYAKTEEQELSEYDSEILSPLLIFLGLDRRTEEEENGFVWKEEYRGVPYFALDLSPPPLFIDKADRNLLDAMDAVANKYIEAGFRFVANRVSLALAPDEAAIYGAARHLIDWNSRNPFCGGCGHRTLSVNGGWKRVCPPKDAASSTDRPSCATRQGISNLSFPRTDAVIIVAVVSADGDKLLLGRQRRFPPDMYSTLAGFLEPGESLEEAVRREVWEEAGVTIARVVLHSSQPWPYPANIMIGAIAQAVAGEDARDPYLDHDAELEAAKWFGVQEVRDALSQAGATMGTGASDAREGLGGIQLRIPPRTAIANQLMEAVANGGFLDEGTKYR